MTGAGWYLVLVAAVALWRGVEVVVSSRNLAWARRHGGFESGHGHFGAMVALHAAFLLGCALETVGAHRPFWPLLGWPLAGVLVLTQGVRLWCMVSLGRAWNTRIVVVPGAPRVTRGPYRWLRHPNYVVVAVEGVALPLLHGAWITAVAFTVLNAVLLLRYRIPAEDAALATLTPAPAPAPR